MNVTCFGDSNTYGFDPRSYFGGRYSAAERWVDILEEKTGWTVFNMGQNGLAIPATEYEAKLYDKILSSASLDLLIIMLGSNDLLQGLSADAVAARMTRFLSQLTVPPEKILLVSPPKFKPGLWVEDVKTIEYSSVLALKYKNLAETLSVAFVDSNVWNIDLAYDGVHFSVHGHKTFAKGIHDYLTNEKEG